jgi:hypothetical protein
LRGHGGTVVANDLDTLLRLGLDLGAQPGSKSWSLPWAADATHEECEPMVKSPDRPNANRHVDYYISAVVD